MRDFLLLMSILFLFFALFYAKYEIDEIKTQHKALKKVILLQDSLIIKSIEEIKNGN